MFLSSGLFPLVSIGNTLVGIDSYLIGTLRLCIASLIFLPFSDSKIKTNDRIRLFIYGSIQFGLMYTCYMRAYHYLPSHLVAIFSILTPVYIVFIHDIRQRTFSKHYLWIAFLSVLGAGFIKAKNFPSGDIWMGFGLMQLAGISFAFGQVAYRDWKAKTPRSKTFLFCLSHWVEHFGIWYFSFLLTDFNSIELSTDNWKSIVYLGCIASGA